MKKFIISILSLLCLFCFTACNSPSDDKTDNTEDSKFEATALNLITTKCVVQQKENYYNTLKSFYDDEYNYWIFDMGVLVDVPLEETYSYYKYTGGNIEHKFTTTKTTANSIKSQTEQAASNSSTWANSHSVSVNVSANFGVDIKVVKWGASIAAGYNYTTSNGGTETNSWSKSFENCESYSESEENTVVITFNNNCEKGYYMYIYVGVINVYVAVIQNRTTNEYFTTTYTSVKAYGYSLAFNASSPLLDENNDTIDFDLSLIDNLIEPTTYISSGNGDMGDNQLVPLTVFDATIRTGSKKINGSGAYTLDAFTLEKTIKELINLGYSTLNIEISYDLKEVDNCKQYVSLFTSTNYVIRSETIEHGGSNKDTSWGTHYMVCDIPLNQLDSNNYYFKCQAENAIFKDFYIGTVKVKIIAEE